jgi:hypothetical protein
MKGIEIQAPPVFSGSSEFQRPKLKTLVIPFVIKSIYPSMSLKEFQVLKEDRTFLDETTLVCEECYLCITLSSECGGAKLLLPPDSQDQIKPSLKIYQTTAKKRQIQNSS